MRSTDALAAVAAAPARRAMAADAVVWPTSPSPPSPLPNRRIAQGHAGRAQGDDRANGRANGHRRAETVVPLPARPDDESDDDYDLVGFRNGAEAEAGLSGCRQSRWKATARGRAGEIHASHSMTIDQALFEMELVGHAFFAYHDSDCGKFSVVYRRRATATESSA